MKSDPHIVGAATGDTVAKYSSNESSTSVAVMICVNAMATDPRKIGDVATKQAVAMHTHLLRRS